MMATIAHAVLAMVFGGLEALVARIPDVSMCELGIEIRWVPASAEASPTKAGPYNTNEILATLKPSLIDMVRLAEFRMSYEGTDQVSYISYIIEIYLSERGREELMKKMSSYNGREYRVMCGSTEVWVSNAAKRPSFIRVRVRGTRERVEAFARTLSNDVAWE